jgi:toxin YoeB
MFTIEIEENFTFDYKKLKKENIKYCQKVEKFIEELKIHPKTGIGKPEILKHQLSGIYSREITKKHRLTYIVNEKLKTVVLIGCYGHYL